MKGKILDFNIQNSSGVISADDNQRYNFNSAEWKSDISPAVNQIVDFSIEGEDARGIYLDKNVPNGETKNKIVAALIALFLGWLGIHKFYLGCTTAGVIMLILGLLTLGMVSGFISFIEFILYLVKSDENFQTTYVTNKKCWF